MPPETPVTSDALSLDPSRQRGTSGTYDPQSDRTSHLFKEGNYHKNYEKKERNKLEKHRKILTQQVVPPHLYDNPSRNGPIFGPTKAQTEARYEMGRRFKVTSIDVQSYLSNFQNSQRKE